MTEQYLKTRHIVSYVKGLAEKIQKMRNPYTLMRWS